MRSMFLTTAAAVLSLAVLPSAGHAQDAPPPPPPAAAPPGPASALTPEQQGEVDGWPADRKAAYEGWAAPMQQYFWSLGTAEREAWWVLTEEQRTQVFQMAPAQREVAWASILEQVSGGPAPAPAPGAPPPPPPPSADAAPPAPQAAKDYPLCRGEVQDSCINPREAGENWGNVPLDELPPDRDTGGPPPAATPAPAEG